MKTVDSEKLVERKLVELIRINNGMCIKLLCDQFTGLPDRLCLFPGHKIAFVELKTTGRKPKRIQAYVHKKLKEQFIDRDTEIDYKSALTEMSHKFDELKKRWDANEAELVNAFKILGYGKE